jgi:hypothetical protein
MRTLETRSEQSGPSAEERAGTNVMQPPAFQLQANPIAPPPPNGNGGANAGEGHAGQGLEAAGADVGDGGRVLQRQVVTPAHGEGEAAQITGPWEEFAIAFSREFHALLPIFDPTLNVDRPVHTPAAARGTTGQAPTPARRGRRGRIATTTAQVPAQAPAAEAPAHAEPTPAPQEPAGPRLTAEQMQRFFSEFHRTELMRFLRDHTIPERLFTGGDAGGLTEGQRVSLSAHILATGRFQRGAVNQRVHGRDCGNWAGIVIQYAGVSNRSTGVGGTHANFDFNGNIVTSNGHIDMTVAGDAQTADHLPQQEGANIGPLAGAQADGHADAEAADRRAHAAWVEAGSHGAPPRPTANQFRRMPQLPWSQVQTLQPGDWVWEFNANSDPRGMHSVIFIRWKDSAANGETNTVGQNPEGLIYRRALCYSQPSPDSGGVPHDVVFGNRFTSVERTGRLAALNIRPVNRIARPVSGGAGITAEGILPNLNRRTRQQLHTQNAQYIHRLETRLHMTFDESRFLQHLRTQNTPRIQQLAGRMSEAQQTAFTTLNASADLDQMLQLYARLIQLGENADILDANIQNQITGPRGLDHRHELWEQRQAAAATRPRPRRGAPAAAHPATPDVEAYSSAQAGNPRNRSATRADLPIQQMFTQADLEPFFSAEAAAVPPTVAEAEAEQ